MIDDRYLALIEKFPLRPIRSDVDLDRAAARITEKLRVASLVVGSVLAASVHVLIIAFCDTESARVIGTAGITFIIGYWTGRCDR